MPNEFVQIIVCNVPAASAALLRNSMMSAPSCSSNLPDEGGHQSS